jgi:hypothetical protein
MAKKDQHSLSKRVQRIFCHDKPKKSATNQTAKKAGYQEERLQEEKRPERLHGLSASSPEMRWDLSQWRTFSRACGSYGLTLTVPAVSTLALLSLMHLALLVVPGFLACL